MGLFDSFVRPGKEQLTGGSIAPGAIDLRHLSPSLFSEIRQIQLHTHSGVKSRKVICADLDGSFAQTGIPIRSPNGTVWHIKVDNSGVVTAT